MKVTLSVTAGPHAGRTFAFDGHDTFLVGRGSTAHFRLKQKDEFFSRSHFMIEVNPPLCRLIDMHSTNGTFVNDARVQETLLRHNDVISAGDTVIRVRVEGGDIRSTNKQVASRLDAPPQFAPPVVQHSPETLEIAPLAARSGGETPLLLAGYRLVREIGRGGMGTVYLAIREADGAQLALKTIRPAGPGNPREVGLFLREASILKKLNHPHIVACHESGEADGRLYVAMEYVEGCNAAELLRRSGPLPVRRATSIVCQVLEALAYAHDLGFVHRDIKPENVLIAARNGGDFVKLADFGLARAYQSTSLSGLTLKGEVGGSLGYMPPEHITSFRESRPAGDLYSAAATLYRLLTGRTIHDLPEAVNVAVLKILQDEPVSILDRRPDLPRPLAAAVHRSLARRPEDRFPDAAVMRNVLLTFAR